MFFPLRYSILLIFFFSFRSIYTQQLSVEDELAFSTVSGKESSLRKLQIRNSGDKNLMIDKLVLQGKNAPHFNLRTPVTFPIKVAPSESLALAFSFESQEEQEPGIVEGNLLLVSNDSSRKQKNVKLYGLVTKGLEGDNEPALHLIVQALGYDVKIGGNQLLLETTNHQQGEEVTASLFKKVQADQLVTILPVARYSSKAPVPFGYYYKNKRDQIRYKKAGSLSDAYQEHQTLFPRLISGETTFDPKDMEFGLFTSTSSKITHTENNLNTSLKHPVLVYPLKDRQGHLIPNNFLLCFEEDEDGDYQDFVFVIKNIELVR